MRSTYMPSSKINGINLHFHQSGKGIPLVFLSGVGSRLDTWEVIVEKLNKTFRCISIDNRGVGKSDKPSEPYSINDMAQDTIKLLKKLNIKSAHIIGQSMGGLIAQVIAYKHPEICRSLTLCSTIAFVDSRTSLIWSSLPILAKRLNPKDFFYVTAALMYSKNTLSNTDWLYKTIKKSINHPDLTPFFTYEIQVNSMLQFDSRTWLNKISTPCLIVSGQDDIITPQYQSDLLENNLRNSFHINLANAGHRAITEDMFTFINELSKFINKIEKEKEE
ncbi:MAG: hypothetical protein CL758_02615 [Chloroflexi bacterium]|nr:hypothetical protein [Chloroflexota bacterium]